MKRSILILLALIFSFTFVNALPVTYNGNFVIDNNITTTAPVRFVSDIDDQGEDFTSTYLVNVVGELGDNVSILIYDVEVDTYIQPIQASIVELNLSFNDSNRLSTNAVCSYDEACLSANCNTNRCCPSGKKWCGSSCKSSCYVAPSSSSSGGGGGGGSWSGPPIPAEYFKKKMGTGTYDLMYLLDLIELYYRSETDYTLMEILELVDAYYIS